MPGPVALVGAGEYLPVMADVERSLLAGRRPRYVQIPTAAAQEGENSLRRWIQLGRQQAQRLGVEAVPLPVRNRADADDPRYVDQIADAGLIYLSGGNPAYLADTLRDTKLWAAMLAAWASGAALAGCSAGAMALTGWGPGLPRIGDAEGLGLLPHLRVLPHFDRFLGRVPDLLTRPFLRRPEGVTLLGIDEDTALIHGLVGGPDEWEVAGRQSVWVLGNGRRREYAAGTTLSLPRPGG